MNRVREDLKCTECPQTELEHLQLPIYRTFYNSPLTTILHVKKKKKKIAKIQKFGNLQFL